MGLFRESLNIYLSINYSVLRVRNAKAARLSTPKKGGLPMKNRIIILSSLLTIVLPLTLNAAEIGDMKFLKQAALQDCSRLRGTNSEVCMNVVIYRFKSLERFLKKHEEYISTISKIYKDKKSGLRKKNLDMEKRETILKGEQKKNQQILRHAERAKISSLLRHIQGMTIEKTRTQAKFEQSLVDPSRIFIGIRSKTQYVCKLRDTAKIECASLAVILSEYPNETGNLILSDIDKLHEVLEMDYSNPILFACGPGVWGNMGVPGSGLSDFGAYMEESGFDSILNKCKQITDSLSTGDTQPDPGGGGFSGVSGFDTLGSMGLCGLEDYNSDGNEFIQNAMEMSSKMHQDCEATLQGTMMETIETVDLPNKKKGDGKKITTATEIIQNGDGTETVTTVDGDGNMISYDRASTQNYDSITVNYDDGSIGVTNVYPNGNTSTMNVDPNGDYHTIDTVDNGDGTTTATARNSEGEIEGTITYDSTDPDIDLVEIPGTMFKIPLAPIVPNLKKKFKESCAGEPCSSCYNFNELNPKLEAAAASGDDESLWVLLNFNRVSTCCSNERAFSGDPRVTIPDPLGDFYCTGVSDKDLEQDMCEERCSLAYSEDCTSNCSSFSDRNGRFNFTLLDHICRYANNEACFIRDSGYVTTAPPALPTPELIPEEFRGLNPYLSITFGVMHGVGNILEDVVLPIVPDP